MSAPPQQPGAAYYPNVPPPSYSEAVAGEMPPPPPGFKPPGGFGIPMIAPQAHVGPEPVTMQCPNCHMTIETSTKMEPGLIAWISGILILLFGFWCGCCLIPCCIDSCMDVHHMCPNCKAYLGRYRR